MEIDDHATIVVLRPVSDEGRDRFEEHVGAPDRALRDGGGPRAGHDRPRTSPVQAELMSDAGGRERPAIRG